MTPDKELAYQARIRELREALESVYSLHTGEHAPEDYELARKVLRDVAAIIRADKCSGESGYAIAVNDATEKHADSLLAIAEELK